MNPKIQASWFSGYLPTQEEVDEIHEIGFELSNESVKLGIKLYNYYAPKMDSVGYAKKVFDKLECPKGGAVFGTFPVPAQAYISQNYNKCHHGQLCYASITYTQAQSEDKEHLSHKQWVIVGALDC